MKRKQRTIQSSMFLIYSLIIISVLFIFGSFFYVWVSNVLRSRAIESIDNLSLSFHEKLDNEIKKLDVISMNILYSNLVKENFINYINKLDPKKDFTNKNISDAKVLTDLLAAIIGPSMQAEQIYLYDFNGNVFGTGFDNRARHINVKDMPWYKQVVQNKNSKVIVPPHKDWELTHFVSSTNDICYISLCRLIFDNYNTPIGIVEVKQAVNKVLNTIIDYESSSINKEQVYIYDRSGKLIYPIREKTQPKDLFYFKYCKNLTSASSSLNIRNPITKSKEILEYRYSDFTNWIIAITIPEKTLMQPVYDFTKLMFIFTGILLLMALILSFNAAKKYTKPLAKLRKLLKEVDIKEDSYPTPQDLGSGIIELEELNKSFFKMNMKVKESVEHMILSEQHENQARMLALQSQMNPHFLYNALTTIGAMADDGMNEEISDMCINISDMLRYISTDKSRLVDINTEIDYTQKYLSCMKIRFGSRLNYNIDLTDIPTDIKVPKLIIQPLVENSLKFCTLKEPPWNVSVVGKIVNDCWQISVIDNGPGFDTQKLEYINSKIDEIERTGLFPNLEVEGMGLLNVYIRLNLIYKSCFSFKIEQNLKEGTTIIIGGGIYEQL